MSTIATNNPGKRLLLMGNEAIARGLAEAGVNVASGYPGTLGARFGAEDCASLRPNPAWPDFTPLRPGVAGSVRMTRPVRPLIASKTPLKSMSFTPIEIAAGGTLAASRDRQAQWQRIPIHNLRTYVYRMGAVHRRGLANGP